ncbi:MAG: hypothetical protein ACR2H1_10255 [Limisphaerales bacterium]
MRPEGIRALWNARPFQPFRICPTDGKAYDIPPHDFVMVARTIIDIGVARNSANGIHDQIVRISPLHIVRVENLQAV